MNILTKTLTVTLFVALGCSNAFANEVRNKIKCHVELVGGGEDLYFVVINHKDIDSLKESLPGRAINLSTQKTTREIYKVFECTNLKRTFKNGRAQRLDRPLER